jgi:hypothetical protein
MESEKQAKDGQVEGEKGRWHQWIGEERRSVVVITLPSEQLQEVEDKQNRLSEESVAVVDEGTSFSWLLI